MGSLVHIANSGIWLSFNWQKDLGHSTAEPALLRIQGSGCRAKLEANASRTNSAFVPRNAWVPSMTRATAVVAQPPHSQSCRPFGTSSASAFSNLHSENSQLTGSLSAFGTHNVHMPASSEATTSKKKKNAIKNRLGVWKHICCLGAGRKMETQSFTVEVKLFALSLSSLFI